MKVVDLVMAAEAAFDIELDDDDMDSLKCLEDLVPAVEKHLGDDGAAGVRVPL